MKHCKYCKNEIKPSHFRFKLSERVETMKVHCGSETGTNQPPKVYCRDCKYKKKFENGYICMAGDKIISNDPVTCGQYKRKWCKFLG